MFRFFSPVMGNTAPMLLACLAATSVFAQDSASIELSPLVIGATRLPTPAAELGSAVTVIGRNEIERKQQRTVGDVLRDVPGLALVQTGGPGGVTNLFIRGTNPGHTKVLLDGIDIGDPSSNGVDFAHLSTVDVERIEVLRGPQSGVWGSDAIGGLVNIITAKGKGPAQVRGSLEGGSFSTFNQTAGVSGSSGRFNYAFDAAHLSTGGTPVTPLALLPPGRRRLDDSYDNRSFSTRLGADLSDTVEIGLITRYVETDLRFTGDDFSSFPSSPAAAQSDSSTRQLFTRATAHLVSFGGGLDHTFGVGYTDYRRRDASPDFGTSINRGDRVKLDWQGTVELWQGQSLVFGTERQRDEIRDSPISAALVNTAGFLLLQSHWGRYLSNAVSLRYDSNDRFGSETTYRIAPALLLPATDTRLRASVGTGFKAPTLEQLFVSFPAFNFFANPNLKPERSLGYDVGFEQTLTAQRLQAGLTWFHNDIDDLITSNATRTSLANVAKATTRGIESFFAWHPVESLGLRANYTYTIATDALLHQALLRRPKHKVGFEADWQATETLVLTAVLLHVGSRADANRDFSVPRLTAPGYTIVNLAASYLLRDGVTLFGRIDNLLDRRYEDPTGFQRPGFGIFAGVKVGFEAGRIGL